MTTMENLVDVALKIDSSAKSGSDETWLIRTGLDYLRKNIKEGRSKEDTIQQIGAEIYRKKHQDYNEPEVIQQFARMVYEELYEKEWNGKLPIVNRQKDWIYQFGFLFKIKVTEKIKQFKTAKIERQLEEQGLEKTEDNIRTILEKENLDRYADQYIKQILG